MSCSATQQKVYNAYFAKNINYLIDQLTHPIRPRSSVMIRLSYGHGFNPCCVLSQVAPSGLGAQGLNLAHGPDLITLLMVRHCPPLWDSLEVSRPSLSSYPLLVCVLNNHRLGIYRFELVVWAPVCVRYYWASIDWGEETQYHLELLLIEERRHIVNFMPQFNLLIYIIFQCSDFSIINLH